MGSTIYLAAAFFSLRLIAQAPNLVSNGDFSQAPGGIPVGWQATGNVTDVSQTLDVVTESGKTCAHLTCTRITKEGADNHAMIAQVGLVNLQAGKTYEFTCRARERGMLGGSVSIAMSEMSVWANCGLDIGLEVGPKWRSYRSYFKATRSVGKSGRLQFWFTEKGEFFLSDVRITEAEIPRTQLTNLAPTSTSHNLVPNGSFESGEVGWSTTGVTVGWGNDIAHLVGQVLTSSDRTHAQFLRIPLGGAETLSLGTDYPRALMQPQTRPLAASRGWIPVVPNRPYTLSCDFRASVSGVKGVLGYVGMDPETGTDGVRQEQKLVDVVQTWSRFQFTFWPTRRYVYVTLGPTGVYDRSIHLDLARVQLESGREASVFAPFGNTLVTAKPTAPSGVFIAGDKPALQLECLQHKSPGVPVSLMLTTYDYFGRKIDKLPYKMTPGKRLLHLPAGWHGWFRVQMTCQDPHVTILTPDVRIAIVPKLTQGETVLGMNHAFADPYLIDIARKIGISQYRDWSLKWNQTEPAKGQFSWKSADEQVDRVLNRHAGVIALLPPFPSAEWSSSAPKSMEPSSDLGDMVRQSWAPTEPKDLDRFAQSVVEHFRRRIHVWEFLNEPIYTNYSLPGPKYGPADYVSLFRSTAAAMRRADPKCRIVGGAASDPGRLTPEMFDLGLLDSIDILNLHMYPGLTTPEKYLPDMIRLNQNMVVHRRKRPIWITEFSYYGIDNPPRQPFIPSGNAWGESRLLVDEKRCADYTIRFLAIMLAQGVERVFIHASTNAAVNLPETECCLFDDRGTPRKIACATAVLAELLGASPKPMGTSFSKGGVYRMEFDTSNQSVTVAWSIRDPVPIGIPLGSTCLDIIGNRIQGSKVSLDESPVYIIAPHHHSKRHGG